jgi:hypothetical protein
MFRAEPMVKIQLLMLASEAARCGAGAGVLRRLQSDVRLRRADVGALHGLPALLPEAPAERYREAWLEAESRLSKLLEQCGDTLPLHAPEDAAAPSLADLQELNVWLKEVWSACLACHDGEERIQDERKHLDALEETLSKLERLNVDLARLLHSDSLLSVNIGSLPANGLKRVFGSVVDDQHAGVTV